MAVVAASAAVAVAAPYLSVRAARHNVSSLARGSCRHFNPCRQYAVGRCVRISKSTVDCQAIFYDVYHHENYTCKQWARAKAKGSHVNGHRLGRAHCHRS